MTAPKPLIVWRLPGWRDRAVRAGLNLAVIAAADAAAAKSGPKVKR